jgi:hypothetical protein
MLRLPVKIILMLAAIAAVVLGAHGLYAYFHPLETMFSLGGGYEKLFFVVDLHVAGLEKAVEWVSLRGLQSWFVPAVLVVSGIGFWLLSLKIHTRFTILRKLHLW